MISMMGKTYKLYYWYCGCFCCNYYYWFTKHGLSHHHKIGLWFQFQSAQKLVISSAYFLLAHVAVWLMLLCYSQFGYVLALYLLWEISFVFIVDSPNRMEELRNWEWVTVSICPGLKGFLEARLQVLKSGQSQTHWYPSREDLQLYWFFCYYTHLSQVQ